jgi:hypothetical protein
MKKTFYCQPQDTPFIFNQDNVNYDLTTISKFDTSNLAEYQIFHNIRSA